MGHIVRWQESWQRGSDCEQALKIGKEERWWYSGMGTEWNTETEQSSYRVTKPRVIYIVYSLGLLVNVCHIYT